MARFEGPPSKRQRISKACETCRKRKSKCDGNQPRCTVCISNDRVCTYEISNRKRGLQSGYVKSLETILGILIRSSPRRDDELRSLLRSPDVSHNIFQSTFIDSCTDSWHQSGLYEDIQRLLDAEDSNSAGAECLPPLIPGHASSNESSPATLLPQEIAEQFESAPDVCCSPGAKTSRDLPTEANELVDYYFRFIHCWFPILERRDVLYTLHAQATQTTTARVTGHRACLSAIFALTIACRSSGRDTCDNVEMHVALAKLEATAVGGKYEIGHVQAMLLIVLVYIGKNQLDVAWVTLGQVSRMFQVALQHDSHNTSRLPHILRGYQILDTIVSTHLAKPWCSVLSSLQLKMDDGGLDEWEGWTPQQHSISDVNQAGKTPLRALSAFDFTSQATYHLRMANLAVNNISVVSGTVTDVENWFNGLPSYCRPCNTKTANPCILSLRLLYNHTIMVVAQSSVQSPQKTVVDAIHGSLDILQYQMETNYFSFPCSQIYIQQIRKSLQTTIPPSICNSNFSFGVLSKLEEDHGKCWKTYGPLTSQNLGQAVTSTEAPALYCPNNSLSNSMHSCSSSLTSNIADRDISLTSIEHNILQTSTQATDSAEFGYAATDESGQSLNVQFDSDLEALLNDDFEVMLQDMPPYTNVSENSAQVEFAQNLGFLTEGDVEADFIAFLENNLTSQLT